MISTLFTRLAKPEPRSPLPSAFSLAPDPYDPHRINLLVLPAGSREQPTILWTHLLDAAEDRDAVLAAVDDGTLDLSFLGRITTIFGPNEIYLVSTGAGS